MNTSLQKIKQRQEEIKRNNIPQPSAFDMALGYSQILEHLKQLEDLKKQGEQMYEEHSKTIIKDYEQLRSDIDNKISNKISELENLVLNVYKGEKGEDGKSVDEAQVIKKIMAQIRQPKDGETPVIDEDRIAQKASKLIKVKDGKDGITPDTKDIADLVIEKIIKEKKVKASHLEGYQNAEDVVRRFVAAGSIRGGGDTVVAGTGISITTNVNGNKVISQTTDTNTVTQTSHGLSVGDVIKSSGAGTYAKAQADSAANAEVVGIVTAVADANTFTFVSQGYITTGVPAVAAGTVMFLDPSTAGALTSTEPSTVGQVSKPLMIVTKNATSAIFNNFRGEVLSNSLVTGDVMGPATSTDETIARFNGTDNKTIQGSSMGITDANVIFPTADSTTAIQFSKADKVTKILNVDTTNSRIGIGITTPSAVLDVASNGGRIRLTQTVTGNTLNGIDFYGYSGIRAGGLVFNQATGEVRLDTNTTYFPTFYASGSEVMRIITTGLVGIGTTNPTLKLDVQTASSSDGVRATYTGSANKYIEILGYDNAGYARLGSYQTMNLATYASGANILLQPNAGNVGIGTTNPRGKFDVSGLDSVAYFGSTNGGQSGAIGNTRRLNYGDILFGRNLQGVASADTYKTYDTSTNGGYCGIELRWGGNIYLYTASGDTTAGSVVTPTARVVIDTSGSVGIGITNPAAKLDITDTTLAGSGSLAGSIVNLAQTWNTSGTPTAVKLNVTDTASNAASLLMDLQVGSVSKFKVDKAGAVTTTSSVTSGNHLIAASASLIGWASRSRLYSSADGVIELTNAGVTDFSRLNFGGTTSSFPALKRSAATINFRLADDSDYTSFVASGGIMTVSLGIGASNRSATGGIRLSNNTFAIARNAGNSADKSLIGLNTSDQVSIDADATGTVFGGTATATTYFLRSVGNALTAAGSSRADALQLAKEVNNVTTAAASTGVILPVGVVGMRITIFNNGANAVQVYASGSETIDGTAGSTGVPLTNTKRCEYFFVAANTWLSAQLGVVSA